MKRSWILALWLGCLCTQAVNAQTLLPEQAKPIQAVVKALEQPLARAKSYEPYFLASARRYGLDPRLLWVVAYLETGFNPKAISPKGARGMMQFMPATAARYGLLDPHETVSAINAAARYLRDLLQRYGQRTDLALAAYNAGEGAVDAALQKSHGNGIPPYRETQNYVRRGLQLLGEPQVIVAVTQKRKQLVENQKEAEAVEGVTSALPRGLTRQTVYVQRESSRTAMTQRRSLYFSRQD